MSKQNEDPDAPEEALAERPIAEPSDEDPPLPPPVRISSISPIAGALVGGIEVTLKGAGFQPDAEVYFGNSQSPAVTFESSTSVRAVLPSATQTGSVNVSLFNTDGSGATKTGGFTYVVTGTGAQAEVLGVAPLSVIEDTETEVTLTGRNLIEAYTNGMLALRGSTRTSVAILGSTSRAADAQGIETLTFTLRIRVTPPLEPLERMAIQVLASRRPGAQSDGVYESSRQMFTVLPRARPVPLAFTANLDPDKPTLVIVAGRNLEGCTLDLGAGATVHLQTSDERLVAAIVTVAEGFDSQSPPQLTVRDAAGGEVLQQQMSVAPEAESAATAGSPGASAGTASLASADSPDGNISLTLTPVPDQKIVGPTEQDSVVFNLNSAASSNLIFDWSNFEITIFERTFVLPIVHEVHLIPFFDGGNGDDLSDSPVLAEVGRLLRLRGVGILVALHVEIIIHIRIALIIGFVYDIWGYGLYNEFPEYGWAIGSVVIGIRIEIHILVVLAFLLAAVQPEGRLRVISSFNLTLDLDFFISADSRELRFGSRFKVNYTRIGPVLNNLLPCAGRFQLAEQNGQTVFLDSSGGHRSYYFPRAEGECCVPWNFDLELVRFNPGEFEETVQTRFRADFCLNAAPPAQPGRIIITSNNPPPTGFPPTLVLELDQVAALTALAEPVDVNGNPTGAPLEDVRNLGYDVRFFLETPVEVVLDPAGLESGSAFAIQPGENVIHAELTPRVNEATPRFNFWPGSIIGFDIINRLAEGREPGIIAGSLPVTVNAAATVTVAPTLAYRADRNDPNSLREAKVLFDLNPDPPGSKLRETVREIERFEPFEQQRPYVLAFRLVDVPGNVRFPLKLTFIVRGVAMRLLPVNTFTPTTGTPLQPFGGARGNVKAIPSLFFKGRLTQDNQQVTVTISSRPAPDKLFEVVDLAADANGSLDVLPNVSEDAAGTAYVPPGKSIGNRHVLLSVGLKAYSGGREGVKLQQPGVVLAVHNDETFEEYRRVFQEAQNIITGAGTKFDNFAQKFLSELNTKGLNDTVLKEQGDDLWRAAFTVAGDDRPLYWTRLRSIGALRAYCKRKALVLGDDQLYRFEWPSRGLDAFDGSIRFGATMNARRAIVTGFDPFELDSDANTSNPSGVIALAFNEGTIGSSQAPVFVRTAIFPVRYKDFNEGLVEKAVTFSLGSIVLLVTCSQNGLTEKYYDIERWAGRTRGPGTDNDNQEDLTAPANMPPGPEFLESTLPYEQAVTFAEKLPGPRIEAALVIDQSYQTKAITPYRRSANRDDPKRPAQVIPGVFRPEPYFNDPDGFTKVSDVPEGISNEGSGGAYLSNEIFYRTALVRFNRRKTLPSGHFHVPPTGNTPQVGGAALVASTREVLNRFLQNNRSFRLRSSGNIAFPRTVINTTSAPLSLTIFNDTNEVVTINAVEVAAPYTFQQPSQPPGRLPITVNAGGSVNLPFTFRPTEALTYNGIVTLRDTSGEVVLTANLSGQGVTTAPRPGRNVARAINGGTVTASSTHFTGNFPAASVVNGDRTGANWGNGGGWNDDTPDTYPDWLEVAFPEPKTISEVDVFTLQDDLNSPVEPNGETIFTLWGIVDFDVEYWTGSAWALVPGGRVTGNNKVWRKFNFAPVTTGKVRVVVHQALQHHSRIVEVEVYEEPLSRLNVALATYGATATASSTHFTGNYPAAAIIDGDRRGVNWGSGGGWNDNTLDAYPDWVQVDFQTPKTINEIDVFTLQDDTAAPAEPTEDMTFTLWGIVDFDVEYWTGSAWATVPDGHVTGNNKVWRKFNFPAVTTAKIRVVVKNALGRHSRIVEVEAYEVSTRRINFALATNGASVAASSTHFSGNYPAAAIISGDRSGINWGNGGGWNDDTLDVYPDWIEVVFPEPRTILEVNVFTLQDNFASPVEPTEDMTFSLYGIVDFDVEYWTGSAWAIVPGGHVTGNNNVWRKFSFAPLTTTKVRVVVQRALARHSRIVEIEAWG